MGVGIALLGAGRWGNHLIRNFLEHPDATLVAIADPSPDRLQHIAHQYALDAEVALETDWQVALRLPSVMAVVIATPAATHQSLIQAALQAGHHVLAEKPLTLDWQSSLALCELAERQQRQLVVDHTYLFHPAVQRGGQLLRQRAIGSLRYGYATRTHLAPVRHDVDALWDLAIHDIAMFNQWLQETPCQVQAQGTTWLQTRSRHPNFPQGLADLVWVRLIYPSGFEAMIHLCWANPDKQRRLCVTGSQGTLIFDELSSTPLTLQQGRLEQTDRGYIPDNLARQAIAFDASEPLQQVCNHFLFHAQRNTPSPISSGWVGAELVKILVALSQSLTMSGQMMPVT
jgi:predicted dehydrogenase